jgi:Undecaprenyl-phosphate galactose phosphotransferase WbaP
LGQLAGQCRARLRSALVVSDGSLSEIADTVDRFRDIFMRVILVHGQDGPRLNWEAAIDMAGIPGLEVRHNLLDRWAQVQKRAIDIFLSGLALILASPLLILTAVAVKLDSPGPLLFRQTRVGKDRRLFGMLKFRTMVVDAERKLAEVLQSDAAKRLEWQRFQKLRDDPRVTRVGRLMRRFSLDELPQVWNVFCGEMSLVGPRPYFPEQEAVYGHGSSNYIRVLPGITGLWQVRGRARSPFSDRVVLDEAYVRTWSVWMDLYILAMTPAAVLSRNGAY